MTVEEFNGLEVRTTVLGLGDDVVGWPELSDNGQTDLIDYIEWLATEPSEA